ncbi:MAG: AMP-binding protein [Bryobacteraceae bacterium]|jgi:phenylacetate-CoA ligase
MPPTVSPPSRAEIEAHQRVRLRPLLDAVLRDNPFYRTKFASAGVSSEIATLEEFSQSVPFTLKQELVNDQIEHPPYGSNLTYPVERYTRFSQTSGSTGQPLRWVDTQESWDWMIGNWTRVFEAAGVNAGNRVFFAFSFGPFLGFWVAFDAASRRGCLCIPGGGMRSAARLNAILGNRATVLCCTPTYAVRLAEVAAEEKIDLAASSVRTIIVAGEAGGSISGTSGHIQRLWHGARVVDHHGMTEVGPVSYGCPIRPGLLHVIESSYIAEVVDPRSGHPVAPGGTGELVLTNLGRLGSPLLRYRTGDLVQTAPAERCECGTWDVAFPGGILGRTDDMVVVRGVNVYPAAVEEIIRSCGGVAEYRVEVSTTHALTELSIQIEPEPDAASDSGLAHRLETALRNAFGLRVEVVPVPSGSLPRFEMKSRRWVRV